jgi:hypothetical protein
MPGPLSALDGQPRDAVIAWLRSALLGEVPVPKSYPDEGLRSAVMSAEPFLESATRRDLADSVRVLFVEVASGDVFPPGDFFSLLIGLGVDLKLTDLVPGLVALAHRFPAAPSLDPKSVRAVLFAIIDLGIPQPRSFWEEIWEKDIANFSPPVLAAILAMDPFGGLPLLIRLPDSPELGDIAALQLDAVADTMTAGDRLEFRKELRAIAKHCQLRICSSILVWLNESEPAADSPLGRALIHFNFPIAPGSAALQGAQCLAA